MVEISSLSLDIDADSVSDATKNLNEFVSASERAERAADRAGKTGGDGLGKLAPPAKRASDEASRAAQAMARFADAAGGAGGAAADLGRNAGASAEALARAERIGAAIGTTIRGVAGAAVLAAPALALLAVNAAQAADDAAKLRAQWEFIAGGSASGAAELAQAAEAADRLGASERTLLDIRARLLPLERSGVTDRQSALALTESLVGVTRLFNDEGKAAEGVLSAYEAAMGGVNVTLADYEALAASLPGLAPRLEAEIANLGANGERDIYRLIRSGELTQEMLSKALPNAMEEFGEVGKTELAKLEEEMRRLRENWGNFLQWLGQTAPVDIGLRAARNTARAVNTTYSNVTDYFSDSSAAESARAAAQAEFDRANALLQRRLAIAQRVGLDPTTNPTIQRLQAATDAAREQLEVAQSRIALLGAEETALASKASLEAEADSACLARARHEADFAATEDGKRLAALNEIAAREAKLAEDRTRNIGDAQTWAAIEAQIKADREALDPKATAPSRDYAKEAEDAQAHAAAMLGAAETEGDAARRREEIRILSEQAARRSGYDAGTDDYDRVLAAEAERLRLEDQRKALEDGRRRAAQAADAAAREAQRKADQEARDSARLAERSAQERADAEKRMAEMGREAQAAEEARAMAAAAASEAALAGSAEELLAIQRRTEALRNEADVRKAGQDAYDALDKGATEPEREAARAQAEAAERAKQAAEIDGQRLGIAQSLIEARMRETDAGVASAHMAELTSAAAGAATAAEIAALEHRAEAQGRAAEADRKAMDARAALGLHATDTERDAAEATSRRLSAQEEELRLQREQLGVMRSLAGLREQSADQAARAALATSTATAALTAQSSAELASLRSREESAARLLETEQSVRAAKERLGPAATDPQQAEAERLTREAEATKEQIRLAGVQMQQVGALIALRERATDATARGALAERAGLSALGAQSRAEIAATQAQSAALERQLDLEQRIRDAKAQLGPEAAAPQLAAAETSERALFAAQEQTRVGGVLIQQAQTLAGLREDGAKATQAAALAEQARAEAIAVGSVLEFDAARRRAEQRQRDASRVDAVKAAAESVGPEADPARIEEAKRLAAARWDAAEAERVATEAAERRRSLLQFEEAIGNRRADAEARLAAFRETPGSVQERLRAADREAAVREAMRAVAEQRLGLTEAQVRADLASAEAAQRALDIETRRAEAAQEHAREAERIRALTAAAGRGPAALREEEVRQAGISAAYANPDDPEAAANAENLARLNEGMELARRAREALTSASDRYGESARRVAEVEAEMLRLKPHIVAAAEDQAEAERAFAQARMEALAGASPIYAQARGLVEELIEPHQRLNAFLQQEPELREALRQAIEALGYTGEEAGRMLETGMMRARVAAAGLGDVAGSVKSGFDSLFESAVFGADNAGDALRRLGLELSKLAFSKATSPVSSFFGDLANGVMDKVGLSATNGAAASAGSGLGGFIGDLFSGFREHGGTVEAGRAYIVGEKRPELFIPSVSGRIEPRVPDLARLMEPPSHDLSARWAVNLASPNAGRARATASPGELTAPALELERRGFHPEALVAPREGKIRLQTARSDAGPDLSVEGGDPLAPGLWRDLALAAGRLDLARLVWDAEPAALRRPPFQSFGPAMVAPPTGGLLQTAAEGEAEPRGAKRAADLFADSGAHRVPLARLMSMAEAQGGEAVAREAQELKQVGLARRDLFRPPPTPAELPPGRHDAASALRLTAPETQALGADALSPAARAHGAAMLHFFERGGWAAQGAKDEPAGIAHRDEAVWSQANLRAHGGAAFDAASNIIPFARGGIVESPTLFNSSGRQTGIMGEAGPEAILPLRRGADGKLGVAAQVSGGDSAPRAEAPTIIHFNITTPDVASFQRARGQIAADLSRAVASARRNL